MSKLVGYQRPLQPLVAMNGVVPFAIEYQLKNNLGPDKYEEFWLDAKFFVLDPDSYPDPLDYAKAIKYKCIIYGPMGQEIMYPAGTWVIGVSTTEQNRPPNPNNTATSTTDTDADGIIDDYDFDPEDPNVPYADADEDGVHEDTDADDNDPNVPYPDVDEDGAHSDVDIDDNDPNVGAPPEPETVSSILHEYVILAPEPNTFEGELENSIPPASMGIVKQSIDKITTQRLIVIPGAYQKTVSGVDGDGDLIMVGKMRFICGAAFSDPVPWDADAAALQAALEQMSIFVGKEITVTGSIPEIIAGNTSFIKVEITSYFDGRISLWGLNSGDDTMIPNVTNYGQALPNEYRYAFKCRTKYDTELIDVPITCYNASQIAVLDIGQYVICRKINHVWHIIYP